MEIHKIIARDLPDLWFQAVHDILEKGNRFMIDKGSYELQTRLEYDYFIGHIKFPGTLPLLPSIPEIYGIPDPVENDYIYGGGKYKKSYLEYIMTPEKEEGESYTYGERLTKVPLNIHEGTFMNPESFIQKLFVDDEGYIFLNQIEHTINTYKKHGYRNNQLVLQIAQPSDLLLEDPPCLQHIDTRIQNGKLHFFVYFRSWDLWGGMPANLAGIQILKEYMAGEIGVDDGEMIVESKGLHLYGYAEELAKIRCMNNH